MKISVITPSFNNSEWLKKCVASVADQGAALQEHIVQDACSSDGTREWLLQDARVKAYFEKDEGMYDAINRGFSRAAGDILGYLNCDEQYLPGALAAVADFFSSHAEVDAVVGDTVIVDGQARYLCSRLGHIPGAWGTWVRFPVVTSSFFFRKSLWQERKIRFDPSWKIFGDMFFVLDLISRGVRFGVIPEYLSVFFDHGDNLYLRAHPEEVRLRHQAAPLASRIFAFPLFLQHWLKVVRRGGIRLPRFSYAVYQRDQKERAVFPVEHPGYVWKGRSRWCAQAP
jgi:glycosyltransferase involved in cell wall biosynthesis